MDSDTIVWENPPTSNSKVDYAGFYALLRDNVKQWARYPGTQSAASQWCARYTSFEYKSTMMDDGERRVWMRFVGAD